MTTLNKKMEIVWNWDRVTDLNSELVELIARELSGDVVELDSKEFDDFMIKNYDRALKAGLIAYKELV